MQPPPRRDPLRPWLSCLEDAELLEWLVLGRSSKQLSASPAQADRQHSRGVFEELLARHEGCHEALFGLGRVCVLDRQYAEARGHLERAVELLQDDALYLAWLAWALLLLSSSQNLVRCTTLLARASWACREALRLAPQLVLALRCLVHLSAAMPVHIPGKAISGKCLAMQAAIAQPQEGLYVLGRTLLGDGARAAAGEAALRDCLAEVPIEGGAEAEVAAAIAVRRCLAQMPEAAADAVEAVEAAQAAAAAHGPRTPRTVPGPGGAVAPGDGEPWDASVVSVKLMALDALWRHLVHTAKQHGRAAEDALLAAASLRPCAPAWQRAVCLALKALAFEGRWDDCWRLAAAELNQHLSREVLYQCGRLAFFDGRPEAIDAYLPHLISMMPAVPAAARPNVQFWAGMLLQKRGQEAQAARLLQAAAPLLEAFGQPEHLSKLERSRTVVSRVRAIETEARRLYDFSNLALQDAKRRQEEARFGAARVPAAVQTGRPAPPVPAGEGAGAGGGRGARAGLPEASAAGGAVGSGASAKGAKGFSRGRGGSARALWDANMVLELQSSTYSSPWKIYNTWTVVRAAKDLEARDSFLGKLCRGRLALAQGLAADAEKLWQQAAAEFPRRVEPLVELWQLHSWQGAHKKAVLVMQRAVDSATSPESELGQYVTVDVDVLLRHKAWAGAAGTLGLEHVAHLLLGRSLRRCGLWTDAWNALQAGNGGCSGPAPGPFAYQLVKVCVAALQDLIAQAQQRQGAGAIGGQPGAAGAEAAAAAAGPEAAALALWAGRARSQLQAFSQHERTDADRRKGSQWRSRLGVCLELMEDLERRPQPDAPAPQDLPER